GIGRHEDEHFVAGLQGRVAAGNHEPVCPDDRDDHGIAWKGQIGDGRVVGRRVLGQGDLDQVGDTALELEQAYERSHRDRLLDEGGEELRGGDRDVDPPALVEE